MSDVAGHRLHAILTALDPLQPDDIAVVSGVWLERSDHDKERTGRETAVAEARQAIDRGGRTEQLEAALAALRALLPGADASEPAPHIEADALFEDAIIAIVAWDLIPNEHARELYLPFSEWWQQRRPDVPSPFL